MKEFIRFVIYDVRPVPKGRARASLRSGHIHHYTPQRTVDFEAEISLAAIECMRNNKKLPTKKPIALMIDFGIKTPESWSKAKKARAINREIYPKIMDVDNVTKAIQDAMNGHVYEDDVQIVLQATYKYYSSRYEISIKIDEIEAEF